MKAVSKIEPAPIRVKDLSDELGISKGHASDILRGETEPSQKLAIRIFRRFGLKLGPIARSSTAEISLLEKILSRGAAE